MVDRDAPYSGLATLMNMSDKNPNTQLAYIPSNDLNTRYKTMYNPSTGIPQAIGISALHEGGLLSNTNINKDSRPFSNAGLAPDPFNGGPPDWYLSDQDRNTSAPIPPIPPANGGPPDWYLPTPRPRPNNGLVVDDFGLRPNDVKGGGKGPDIGGGTGGPMLPKDTGVGFGGIGNGVGIRRFVDFPSRPSNEYKDSGVFETSDSPVDLAPIIRYRSDGGSISRKADEVASYGRYGDTTLVHMTPSEVGGLASLGELTINPETGLPEAFSLKSLLPTIGGIAASFLLPIAAPTIFGVGGALGGGIGSSMVSSGIGTLIGGLFGGKSFGEAALGGIMGGITGGAMKGLSGLLGGGASAAGADVAGSVATSTAANVADTGVQTAVEQGASMAGLDMGANAPKLLPSVFDGVSAAYPAPTVPSSGLIDFMSDNKGLVGGLGLAGILSGGLGDEQYPEEEPQEIKPFPRFEALGGKLRPEDLKLTEEEIYRRAIEGYENTEDAQYFTPLTYKEIPDESEASNFISEYNTGGLLGLGNNQGTSQSSGVSNFLQPKQGNNNVDPEEDIFNSMYNFGANAGKADKKKGVQSLVSPVDVVAPPENTGRLKLELLGGGKHRYVRDTPLVEEPEEIIPVPDTNEEPSDNDDEDEGPSNAGGDDTGGVGEGPDGSQGPPAATGGLISMLKKADGGIVSLNTGGKLTKANKDLLRAQLLQKESSGNYSAINRLGYVGGYQFGAMALEDLGYIKKGKSKLGNKAMQDSSNWTGKNNIKDLNSFLENTSLQDKTFDAYSKLNLKKLKELGEITESSTPRHITGMLAASHLLGATGASKSLDSTDANNTSGLEYYHMGSKDGIMQYPQTDKDTSYKGGVEELEGGFLEGLQTLLTGNTKYTVKEGDTISAIAKNNNIPIDALLAANEIKNPNKIDVNQKVDIPNNDSSILDRISKLIKFSEGGTLEQYYQGQVIGKGDGMSDEILFDVEGRNPDMALLSRDEYVIPADVVSMIGNGSSNAGAEELDGFLKNVRQQSFGTRKQQREMTNPQKGLSALV